MVIARGGCWQWWSFYHFERFSPAPSSQVGCLWGMLIVSLEMRLPLRHRCVARTIAMPILECSHPHTLKYVFSHFCDSTRASLFTMALASSPSIPSVDTTKGVKCLRCCWQWFRCFFFLLLSAVLSTASGDLLQWDLESVFTIWTSISPSVPLSHSHNNNK